MDRTEAAEALALLRRVVSQVRDDTALQNWGTIWIVNGVVNAAAFLATHHLLQRGHRSPGPFALLWGVTLAVGLGAVLGLHPRDRAAGARTFFERQIWAIWTSFIAAMVLLACINYLLGLDHLFMGPAGCLLSAVCFATMGHLMGAGWYLPAAVFAAAALGSCLLPAYQLVILGGLWGVVQCGAGVVLVLARRRRLRGGEAARLV